MKQAGKQPVHRGGEDGPINEQEGRECPPYDERDRDPGNAHGVRKRGIAGDDHHGQHPRVAVEERRCETLRVLPGGLAGIVHLDNIPSHHRREREVEEQSDAIDLQELRQGRNGHQRAHQQPPAKEADVVADTEHGKAQEQQIETRSAQRGPELMEIDFAEEEVEQGHSHHSL